MSIIKRLLGQPVNPEPDCDSVRTRIELSVRRALDCSGLRPVFPEAKAIAGFRRPAESRPKERI